MRSLACVPSSPIRLKVRVHDKKKKKDTEKKNTGDFEYLPKCSSAEFDLVRRLIALNERACSRGDRYRPALQIVFGYREFQYFYILQDISAAVSYIRIYNTLYLYDAAARCNSI
jgi:hypothetical protein